MNWRTRSAAPFFQVGRRELKRGFRRYVAKGDFLDRGEIIDPCGAVVKVRTKRGGGSCSSPSRGDDFSVGRGQRPDCFRGVQRLAINGARRHRGRGGHSTCSVHVARAVVAEIAVCREGLFPAAVPVRARHDRLREATRRTSLMPPNQPKSPAHQKRRPGGRHDAGFFNGTPGRF